LESNDHPCGKTILAVAPLSGHGGIDFNVFMSFIDLAQAEYRPPMDDNDECLSAGYAI